MSVAHPVAKHEASCVAAGRQRSMLELQEHRGRAVCIGTLDSNLPGSTQRSSVGAQIAAKIHEKGLGTLHRQNVIRPIDSVFLSNAAEIQLHALWHEEIGRSPL